MQYASVIVDKRLGGLSSLVYSIPPALLTDVKIGQLVEVEISNKKCLGIIKSFTRKKPENKIKPIIKLKSKNAVVSSNHLRYYKLISFFSLSSINDTLFYFLPNKIKFVDYDNNHNGEQILNQSYGKIKIISGTTKERYNKYLNLINRYKETLIFIFPNYNQLNLFKNVLDDNSILYLIYSGNLKAQERWRVWFKAHTDRNIILTTRIGFGIIPNRHHITVIEQPSHIGFIEDQRPRFSIFSIIKARMNIGENIILGDNLVSPTLQRQLNINQQFTDKNVLVNNDSKFLENLNKNIDNNKRVLIANVQKGQWGILICSSCNQIYRCNKCNYALTNLSNNKLYCLKCTIIKQGFEKCTRCGAHNYTGFGIGNETLFEILKESFPKIDIVIVDKDNKVNNIRAINKDKIIVIATSSIFDYPVDLFDLTICINYDGLLAIPNFNQEEKIFKILYDFSSLAKKTIIATTLPEQKIFSYIGQKQSEYILGLLSQREPLYPPFTRIVDVKTTANEIVSLLERYSLDTIKIEDKQIVRCFIPNTKWSSFYEFTLKYQSKIIVYPDPIIN